jgi:hypothetical protein
MMNRKTCWETGYGRHWFLAFTRGLRLGVRGRDDWACFTKTSRKGYHDLAEWRCLAMKRTGAFNAGQGFWWQ